MKMTPLAKTQADSQICRNSPFNTLETVNCEGILVAKKSQVEGTEFLSHAAP